MFNSLYIYRYLTGTFACVTVNIDSNDTGTLPEPLHTRECGPQP